MRLSIRSVPWLLALAGLAIPLVGSGFVVWPLVLLWLAILGVVWLIGGAMVPSRGSRILATLLVVPVLFVLAWEGGLWLIPAVIALLVIEIADRGPRGGP